MRIKVHYITTSHTGHFSTLKVLNETKEIPKEMGHMDNYLWFDNEQDAKELLEEIKQAIRKFYKKKGKEKDCPFNK